jgi:hypothetical protein
LQERQIRVWKFGGRSWIIVFVMCVGCVSAVDKWVYLAAGTGAVVEAGLGRLRAAIDPKFAAERHVLVWERNAEFCAYVGLDPCEVLGPKPAPLLVPEPRWKPMPDRLIFATT